MFISSNNVGDWVIGEYQVGSGTIRYPGLAQLTVSLPPLIPALECLMNCGPTLLAEMKTEIVPCQVPASNPLNTRKYGPILLAPAKGLIL